MSSKVVQMAADEAQWQAEEDARTLARADAIMKDPERKEAAAKDSLLEEERRAKEYKDRASGMAKIAGIRRPKVPGRARG